MEPLDAFKAALDDWQQHKEDSSRREELLRCFTELGAWRANVVLDMASMAAGGVLDYFLPVWIMSGLIPQKQYRLGPRGLLLEWIQQLQQCALMELQFNCFMMLNNTLAEFATSVLLDPAWGDSAAAWRDTRMWTHGHKQQAAGGTSQPRLAGAVEAVSELVIVTPSQCT